MRKNLKTLFCTAALAAGMLTAAAWMTGCGRPQTAESTAASEAETDQAAADRVAALIDSIYVQKWTEDTESQCMEARKAWDALTDAQKELVEGENADPDYFGRDTGDASLDNPRNQDEIGEKEILAVSFGTSFNDSRVRDISAVEDALQAAYPDWSVRRAFTAQIIINHIMARDGEKIDNMQQALDRAVKNGVRELVIQPTHLMHGAEYDELSDAAMSYKDKFAHLVIAEPLLGETGTADPAQEVQADAAVLNADKKAVVEAVTADALSLAGFSDLQAAEEAGTAFVFMGHGTSHPAKVTYSQMQAQVADLGYANVFIGTVEGEPEDTSCEAVIEKVRNAGYKKVILRPLMVVAGDHANNDMAGEDDDSWKSKFDASGAFDAVDCQIEGLGRIAAVQQLYVEHVKDALSGTVGIPAAAQPEDGRYTAKFDTDSSMFHVNEAEDGRGILTVRDGKMSIHLVMPSQKIVHLYSGKAEDAARDGAALIDPSVEEVTYADGSREQVYAFDLPVSALNEDFPVALIGTKGKWYDHMVKISDLRPAE